MMPFFVYMLRCADGSFYVGHTDSLEQRFAQHESGFIKGYTWRRRPVALAYSQEFQTRDDAFRAEGKLKGWSRAKKQALVEGDWARISELAVSHENQSKCGADPSTTRPLRGRSAQGERDGGRPSVPGAWTP